MQKHGRHQTLTHVPDILGPARARLMPPEDIGLADWMERYIGLPRSVSVRSCPAGSLRLDPDQRGIADMITDPTIESIAIMKSARRGMTMLIVGAVGYRASREGGNIGVVQPNATDAEEFGKDQFVPMVEASPIMLSMFPVSKAKDSGQTLKRKAYKGGIFYLIGAQSGAGFRRKLIPWVFLDEADGMPVSAGDDGDQVKLSEKRGQTSWERKIVCVSTPLIKGKSKIETLFLKGDQRRFFVPCPQCGHMDYLVFDERPSGGHFLEYDEESPLDACFICFKNGCTIEPSDKEAMLAAGEWRPTAEAPPGRVSVHVWAAYGNDPKATWGMIAQEYEDAKEEGEQALRVHYNQTRGETFEEAGEVPDWELLYARRERYPLGTVPDGVKFITCGVDVAPIKGRFDYEIVGWDLQKRSWSIEAGEIYGPMGDESTWHELDELLAREFVCEDGSRMNIMRMAIDSGADTQRVYNWARQYNITRVITVKGKEGAIPILSAGRPVDVTVSGKTLKGGHRNFIVGSDTVKSELYGWLNLNRPDEHQPHPPGWCHFPEYDQEFFKQLTAEIQVIEINRKGVPVITWKRTGENHKLDCRVYARAAATGLGLDRVSHAKKPARPTSKPGAAKKEPSSSGGSWLGGKRGRRRSGGGWLGK